MKNVSCGVILRWIALLGCTMFFFAAGNAVAAEGAANLHQARIIGGTDVLDPDRYPWMAALVESGEDIFDGQFCGGTLVSPRWVLTAAHCVVDDETRVITEELDVVLGTLTLEPEPGAFERIAVAQVVVHPGYDPETVDDDIALLFLASPSAQQPVDSLAMAGADPEPGARAWAAGWGLTSEDDDGFSPVQLLDVDLDIVSNTACNAAMGDGVTENMLCAGPAAGGKGICSGDSGGPLVVLTDGSYQLVGISSWGSDAGCGVPDTYSVFTRVSQYGDWINAAYQECLFAALEEGFPEYLAPSTGETLSMALEAETIRYRPYLFSGAFLATFQDELYYYGPLTDHQWSSLGGTPEWLETMHCR